MTSGRTQTIHVGLRCLHMWVSSIFIALASSKTSMICRFMFSNRAQMCSTASTALAHSLTLHKMSLWPLRRALAGSWPAERRGLVRPATVFRGSWAEARRKHRGGFWAPDHPPHSGPFSPKCLCGNGLDGTCTFFDPAKLSLWPLRRALAGGGEGLGPLGTEKPERW